MTVFRDWLGGKRLIGQEPHGHWHTMSFIAALRFDRIDAPFVPDQPVTDDASRVCVEQFPLPDPAVQ